MVVCSTAPNVKDCSKRLHFTPKQTYLIEHHLDFFLMLLYWQTYLVEHHLDFFIVLLYWQTYLIEHHIEFFTMLLNRRVVDHFTNFSKNS